MNGFELGVVIPIMEMGPGAAAPSGTEAIAQARRAEALGFDTV